LGIKRYTFDVSSDELCAVDIRIGCKVAAMPDVYTRVTEAPAKILEALMTALELRAADPQLRSMVTTYLNDAALPTGARVLEVGCGTGAVTRVLATWPGVGATIGVDPSPVFVAKARELVAGLNTPAFEKADGRALPFDGNTFDAVVFHTTLCHVPEPEVMLGEAVRVLRPGARLACVRRRLRDGYTGHQSRRPVGRLCRSVSGTVRA
jgi:ubiquinone/menaquinone biosynthesis C-methylase UbiE